MKNITELRDEIMKVYKDVRHQKILSKKAKARVSISNFSLKSLKLELEHNKFSRNKEEIGFMKSK